MLRLRALSAFVIAAGMALATLSAHPQSTPPAKVKRAKVDARTMVPGPQASDAAASDARASSGLTRDQRKEATLQARQEGTLQPAGDTAEPREGKPQPLAAGNDPPRSEAAAVAPTEPAGSSELATSASDTANVATAASPASTKKGTRKKARGASGAPPT
jgi:hypothetical protein